MRGGTCIITFGEKEVGKEYIYRAGAYAVIFHDEKVAVIQTSDGKFFLPGGGIESNENHQECLNREALEEMGMEIKVGEYLGAARRYFYSTNQYKYYLSDGYFYICNKGKVVANPMEEDHHLIWLEPKQAAECLFHEHQSWAIEKAMKL